MALDRVVLVTPRSFGVADPAVRLELEAAVREVRYNDLGRPYTSAELAERLGDVDALIAGLDEVDATALDAAPRLRVVARYGVGVSNVDLQAAARRGVVVTNTPGANATAVAELTIGLIFALARGIVRADRAVRDNRWPTLQGHQVAGKTLGILGFGQIGRALAMRATALGLTVVAYDPYPDAAFAAAHAVRLAPLDEVVAEARFLSLHLPLTPETDGLVDRDLLASMSRGSYLINTARGELVVEDDLLWALDNEHLAGAALDTLWQEPPPPDHPFLQRGTLILTSHIGANTGESATAMGRVAVAEALAVLSGRQPRFAIAPPGEIR